MVKTFPAKLLLTINADSCYGTTMTTPSNDSKAKEQNAPSKGKDKHDGITILLFDTIQCIIF